MDLIDKLQQVDDGYETVAVSTADMGPFRLLRCQNQ